MQSGGLEWPSTKNRSRACSAPSTACSSRWSAVDADQGADRGRAVHQGKGHGRGRGRAARHGGQRPAAAPLPDGPQRPRQIDAHQRPGQPRRGRRRRRRSRPPRNRRSISIEFPEVHAAWEVIDSRGIFEATRPDGAPGRNAVEQVQEDMLKHKPDVILHAVAARETRSMSEDMRVGKDDPRPHQDEARRRAADGDRADADRPAGPGPRMAARRRAAGRWPSIKATLDYVVGDILGAKAFEPFDPAEPGSTATRSPRSLFVSGVIPVAAPHRRTVLERRAVERVHRPSDPERSAAGFFSSPAAQGRC